MSREVDVLKNQLQLATNTSKFMSIAVDPSSQSRDIRSSTQIGSFFCDLLQQQHTVHFLTRIFSHFKIILQ